MQTQLTDEKNALNQNIHLPRTMPAKLVMIRHGESEANVIQRAIKKGKLLEFPPGFGEIPDREIRLSKLGITQALRTGPWLRKQYPEGFDVIYVSDHTRAKETAALICQSAGWENCKIRIDPLLGERNWGLFPQTSLERRNQIMLSKKRDPLHTPMPDGETILETRHRSRELLDRATREFGGKRVLVFSHGEYIEAIWAEIAHFNTEDQVEFFKSDAGDLKNCQIVEFSGESPLTGEYIGKLRWVRSSCAQAEIIGKWTAIERKTFSPAELLKQVNSYPILNFPGMQAG